MKKLSIVIPVYNEESTIQKVLSEITNVSVSLKKEIIIVNDGSTDETVRSIKAFMNSSTAKGLDIKLFTKENGGKGSAVRRGMEHATGDIVLIQDADLEYDPHEYQSLIDPIIKGTYKVVYGSRILKKSNKFGTLPFYLGGRLVTVTTNVLFLSRLTDEPTCYKVFHKDVLEGMNLVGDGFEWEPEITAKLLRRKVRIGEVPISYFPRTMEEGKKINWKDGLHALYTLAYWRFKKF